MDDLAAPVARSAARADRASASLLVRAVLAVVAVEIVVFALPDLMAGDESGEVAHGSRHLGAFAIAYAVALLVVVVRPARARTILPVAAVLAGALVITAVVDLANGNVPLAGEALHLPEILSVGLVWLIANRTLGHGHGRDLGRDRGWRLGRRAGRRRAPAAGTATLRVVEADHAGDDPDGASAVASHRRPGDSPGQARPVRRP
jgi:peptidoglycan/LPS O-acetylase OafA/YrhL